MIAQLGQPHAFVFKMIFMYIVAIAWMYVVVLMAATQPTVLAGIGTVVFYGVLPCAVVMYILMAPSRAKRKKALAAMQAATAAPISTTVVTTPLESTPTDEAAVVPKNT